MGVTQSLVELFIATGRNVFSVIIELVAGQKYLDEMRGWHKSALKVTRHFRSAWNAARHQISRVHSQGLTR